MVSNIITNTSQMLKVYSFYKVLLKNECNKSAVFYFANRRTTENWHATYCGSLEIQICALAVRCYFYAIKS